MYLISDKELYQNVGGWDFNGKYVLHHWEGFSVIFLFVRKKIIKWRFYYVRYFKMNIIKGMHFFELAHSECCKKSIYNFFFFWSYKIYSMHFISSICRQSNNSWYSCAFFYCLKFNYENIFLLTYMHRRSYEITFWSKMSDFLHNF